MNRMLRRLTRTSPAELRFRATELARTGLEAFTCTAVGTSWRRETLLSRIESSDTVLPHVRGALHSRDWLQAERALRRHFRTRRCRFVIDPSRREATAAQIRVEFPDAPAHAAARAGRLLEGRFDLLGYRDLVFGERGEIDWHRDPVHDRRAPLTFWRRVPFLDPRIGDHKIIWELNRHQHFLALGRAAWLTGDRRYVQPCIQQLQSWMAANPPLLGVNWASMLELAFRSLSWLWALHFVVGIERDESRTPWVVDLLLGLDRQLEHVAAHLSTYFSPNTHLLGEALALYVAGQALPELRGAGRWARLGREVLLHEATAQVHPDGGHAELSAHYHRYALDFYLLALVIARRTGDADAAPAFEEVASRMARFCRTLADDRGRLPMLGDDDGGMLFPMCGRDPVDARDTLCLAASLLQRPELAATGPAEEALWMLGGDRSVLARPEPIVSPASQAFPDTGYAVLRSPGEHLIFDAGPHGFSNGGHAHADTLAVVLSVYDAPLLIDPGTATYTMDPALRDRLRSTVMHNTVVLDGRMPSEPAGPFHWRSRANARAGVWRAGTAFDFIEGAHDGYAPTAHRRAVLTTREGLWIIVDHVVAEAGRDHAVEAWWHLDASWKAHWADRASAQFLHAGARWAALASTLPEREQFEGDEQGFGWMSPAYGRQVPAITLRYSGSGSGTWSFMTVIGAAESPRELAVVPATATAEAPDDWHRLGATITFGRSTYVALFATARTPNAEDARRRVSQVAITLPAVAGAARREAALATDARVALLKLSEAGEPTALSLVDGRAAMWSGEPPLTLALPAPAADLHLDIAAQRRLSRAGGTQRLG